MIVLRGKNDFYTYYKELKQLPIEVQKEIKQTLVTLDESYGEPDNRLLEGGKVLLIEDEIDAENVNNNYGLSMHEFADEIQTKDGNFLEILIIFGTENNTMIIGKKEILQSYLQTVRNSLKRHTLKKVYLIKHKVKLVS